ncbi:hypothetical protein [Azospirillum sp. sgz302134]
MAQPPTGGTGLDGIAYLPALRPLSLTPTQSQVLQTLRLLCDDNGVCNLSLTELADIFGTTKGPAWQMLRRIEQRGWIRVDSAGQRVEILHAAMSTPFDHVGWYELPRDHRDIVRILHELTQARHPICTYWELAAEMDLQVDEARDLVEDLVALGWLRVPFDAHEPIAVLHEPGASLEGWEAWWQ